MAHILLRSVLMESMYMRRVVLMMRWRYFHAIVQPVRCPLWKYKRTELVALTAGWAVGVAVLDIQSGIYIDNTIEQLALADFFTGMAKAGVFGLILGSIASYNGLSVTGGAAGVGKATTHTVVHSIVAIIVSDLVFTAVFYQLGFF